jgi:hypothetical protein
MTLRPQYSLINSEFNEFLFASVGVEKTGIELTVLSALTRLGVDPWGEAARLSDLPREAAARALAAAIAALPEGEWKVSDSWAIAARLVDRLPGRGNAATRPVQAESRPDFKKMTAIAIWLISAILLAAVLFAAWNMLGDHAAEPAATTSSSAPQ